MKALRWFGTDGIRGIAFEGIFTLEKLRCIGQALGRYIQGHRSLGAEVPWVLLGVDTRASGPHFACALSQGLSQEKVDFGYLGVCSSPALAWLCRHHRANLGIMVSASHNPAEYNGIKCFLQDGSKLSVEEEYIIESYIEAALNQHAISQEIGIEPLRITHDQVPYERALTDLKSLKGLRVVLDAANGSVWQQAARCFEYCGGQVVSILGHAPNGHNINKACGVLHPEALQAEVVRMGADLGFCFDGDGDRVGVVDRHGQYWNGDHILSILAEESRGIVGTLMSNYGLERQCQEKGQVFVRTDVGDRYVSQALVHHQLRWGGESSGHIIDYEFLPVGDGLWIALSLAAQYLLQHKRDCFPAFKVYPGIQANLSISDPACLQGVDFQGYIRNFYEKFGSTMRVVIRPSGTEPVLRVLLEGEDPIAIKDAMQALLDQLQHSMCGTVESSTRLSMHCMS